MPKSNNYRIINPRFVIVAYKGQRRIGYLFWYKTKNPITRSISLTLRIARPGETRLAFFDSYEDAELALKEPSNGKFCTLEETFLFKGYDLEILEFSSR